MEFILIALPVLKVVRNCFCMCCVRFQVCFLCNSPVFDYRTPLGRGRAWLRLALMQKKLSDYMKTIINRKDLLRSVCIVLVEDHWHQE